MLGTVELLHNKFKTKFESLKNLTNFYESEIVKKKICCKLTAEVINLEESYLIGVSHILNIYYDECDEELQDKSNELYYQFVISENILGKMDEIVRQISVKNLNRKGKSLLKEYKCNKIMLQLQKNKLFDICDTCSIKMTIHPESSELVCEKCGQSKILYGTIFEEFQYNNQDNMRSRQSTYDPCKHCKKWLDQIQARENRRIPAKHIEKIRQCALQDYTITGPNGEKLVRSMDDMECSQIREWLKAVELTKYNDNAPLIRKIITGIIPYQLEYEPEQEILIDFSKAMKVFEKIKKEEKKRNRTEGTRSNNPYYPYGLFKIIDGKFSKGHPARTLLKCIHLQSNDTLQKNDLDWKQICNRMRNFIPYKPTDPNMEL